MDDVTGVMRTCDPKDKPCIYIGIGLPLKICIIRKHKKPLVCKGNLMVESDNPNPNPSPQHLWLSPTDFITVHPDKSVIFISKGLFKLSWFTCSNP